MPNKKTVALTDEEYKSIITTMRTGFEHEGKTFRPNNRIATILVLEANLGIRIGDVLQLHFNNIIRDGDRYRLDIVEEKTKKKREFTVPIEIYNYIKMYYLENRLKPGAKLFDISERAVQKQLKLVCDYLSLPRVSTHSFRKMFATRVYINNNYNIVMVKELLQHSSAAVTQKYIGISSAEIEKALEDNVWLL